MRGNVDYCVTTRLIRDQVVMLDSKYVEENLEKVAARMKERGAAV